MALFVMAYLKCNNTNDLRICKEASKSCLQEQVIQCHIEVANPLQEQPIY